MQDSELIRNCSALYDLHCEGGETYCYVVRWNSSDWLREAEALLSVA